MSKKQEEHNVVVLSRDEITTYPKLGQGEVTVIVTYVAAGLAPKSVYIPKKEYSLLKEKELIKADITARLGKQPETYRV